MTQEPLNRTNAFNAGKRQNRADLHNLDKSGQSYSNAICWGIMSSPANGRRDDVKSVRNPVRSAKWWTEQFHCFSFCLRMTDKRQKAAKVKCKRDESLIKTANICGIQSSLEAFEFCWSSFADEHNTFTKIDQEKRKIEVICICSPMTTGFIM